MARGMFPSAAEIVREAERSAPQADINEIHSKTFELIKKYRERYYKDKVKSFLSRKSLSGIPQDIKVKLKKELLRPIRVDDKIYSNFMEETSRRISQVFQVISGNIAEICVERELIKNGLKIGKHYDKKIERTDIIVYYPRKDCFKKKHRVEVKNVKLRERGLRGLAFDGDSMVGFFNEPSEFTTSTIKLIEKHCKNTGGYCYVPQEILQYIDSKGGASRFRLNTEFSKDIKKFVEEGNI